MPRANEEASSKRLLTVACCVLTWMICAQAASAGTIFFDDFNDGNAGDGMPGPIWVPGSGTWDASSGDYVATGSLPSRISRVSDRVFGDISARTQARVVGNVSVTLGVRQGNQGYAGTIRPNGSMAIARLDAPDSPILLGSAVVPFNPVQQDVMLQFDAFGGNLSLWAWPVGQPMPTEPQVVAFDNTYAEGPFGLVSASSAGLPSDSTTFRFVEVADTHIVPEPSTFVLMILGVCALIYAARRRMRA